MDRPPPHDYPFSHHHPHPQQPPHFGFPSQFPPFPYQQYPRPLPLPPHPLLFPPPHPHPPLFLHPPPFAPPPPDPDLHKRIDKLVEYAAKNGPEFESMIREKQQDNPAYAFLFGAEGAAYYRYKLWVATRPPVDPMDSPFGHVSPIASSTQPRVMNLHQGYHHIHHQLPQHPVPQPYLPFKGLAGPLPVDVVAELNGVLGGLTGTKESIKGAKVWFMQRAPFAPALAEAFKERVFLTDDSEKQLHVVFLANDILFDSLQRRANPSDLDNEALAFKPVLGPMLARIYHNPHNKDANQSRLEKILQFWASKEVYDLETIRHLESVMTGGVPLPTHYGAPDAAFPMDPSGLQQNVATHALRPRQPGELELTEMSPTSVPSSHFIPPAAPPIGPYPTPANPALFPGSLPIQSSMQAVAQPPVPNLLPPSSAGVGDQVRPPPYPLFPPGLIPGMVRKMQIGSGVPYSPLSPLDIPTVIPPSTVPQLEILERVSKFFKEIGEANPSEGPMKSSNSAGDHDDYEHDEYEREMSVRKGGACIPPPASLNVDPETGTFPDGSVDRKHGSSGRLGLGATADPNEVSQYDDVYSSYRKQRSSTYHSSMSVRSSTR